MKITDEMVIRFLSWTLPKDFMPDGGVTFTPPKNPHHAWPVGTNLLTDIQARAMLEHVLAPVPELRTSEETAGDRGKYGMQARIEAKAHAEYESNRADGAIKEMVAMQAPLSASGTLPQATQDGVWVSRYFLKMVRSAMQFVTGTESMKVHCEIDELLSLPPTAAPVSTSGAPMDKDTADAAKVYPIARPVRLWFSKILDAESRQIVNSVSPEYGVQIVHALNAKASAIGTTSTKEKS